MTATELRKEAYEMLEAMDFQAHRFTVGDQFVLRRNGRHHAFTATREGITHVGSHDHESVSPAIGLLRDSMEWLSMMALRLCD
jgi:hypothetical protein